LSYDHLEVDVKKSLAGFLYFAVTIAILVALLRVADWLPTALQEGLMQKYDSIEEVKERLHLKNIYVPSYFPQSFRWPPSRILAQSRPFVAIVMEFKDMRTGEIALVISQAADRRFVPEKRIRMNQVREKVDYPLNGRAAVLEVGTCGNDSPCSRISWREGIYNMIIETETAPFDLLKIADSMTH
jgi:hypothetical protein